MNACMNAVLHIRKNVLGINQSAFALIAGAAQATVSRWENGELSPDLQQLTAIRAEVLRRGLEWNDAWLFNVPTTEAAA